jgi:uncharacterized protein (DUF1697 family)
MMAVALLRGINVGGKNLLPMKALADIFADAGCAEVKTYIQSGNVLFRSSARADVAAAVRAAIEAQFGLNVPVIVRSAEEMAKCVAGNPFVKAGIDPAWLHVMFLEDEPSADLVAGLDAARSRPDEFAVAGREVYLHLPNGAAKTRLTNAYFDAKLKTVGTQRNWRTVLTLAEMMGVGGLERA